MKIEQIVPQHSCEFELFNPVNCFNNVFSDKHLDNRYGEHFKWFIDIIPRPRKIINFGCGHGNETFALMWWLDALEAVGVDKEAECICGAIRDEDEIVGAKTKVECILNFHRIWHQVRQCVSKISEERKAELERWYDAQVPDGIKNSKTTKNLPTFLIRDITGDLSLSQDKFDLAYSRCVLYLINEPNEVIRAIRNMARVVEPESGKMIVVEPTQVNGTDFNIEELIEQANFNLSIRKVVSGNELGDQSDCRDGELKGFTIIRTA